MTLVSNQIKQKSTVHVSLRDILAQKDQEIARILQENHRLSLALSKEHAIGIVARKRKGKKKRLFFEFSLIFVVH